MWARRSRAALWLAQAAPARQSWWQRFICDIRITDVALIGFALFLLLASLFQGAWMLAAMRASDRTSSLVNEGLISAQRAYVFLREFRVTLTKNPLNDEIQTCTIQPIWENTGTTPTRNGRSHMNWKYFERSMPADFDFPDFDELGNRVLSYDAYKPLIVGPRSTALRRLSIEPAILRQVRDCRAASDLGLGRIRRGVQRRQAAPHRILLPARGVGLARNLSASANTSCYNGVDEDCTQKPTRLGAVVLTRRS